MAWISRVWEFLTSIELLMAMLWLGLAVFTIGLLVLMYTRWGQYKPLRKCVGMSLLAHVLLAGYVTTIEIISPSGPTHEQVLVLSLGDGPDSDSPPGGAGPEFTNTAEQPWEAFPEDAVVQPDSPTLQRGDAIDTVAPERTVRAANARLPGEPATSRVALAEMKPVSLKTFSAVKASEHVNAEKLDAPAAQCRDVSEVVPSEAAKAPDRMTVDAEMMPSRVVTEDLSPAMLNEVMTLPPRSENDALTPSLGDVGPTEAMRLTPVGPIAADRSAAMTDSSGEKETAKTADVAKDGPTASFGGEPIAIDTENVAKDALVSMNIRGIDVARVAKPQAGVAKPSIPDAYRLRIAPDRDNITQSHGGTSATEAAVRAALKWLADNQSADGRWDPRVHGAGKETNALGRERPNAGSRADMAMTGLALLSFLGSGHTHLEGPYRENVRRGLEFLMQNQAEDGNLGGQAVAYEFMYCHAMATCAMSEAYGMTRDQRLREYVRRAIAYTVAAQDPKGGGWRYRPGDAGDTSQLGWQLMSLKSAELAGFPMSEQTRQGVIRYLRSVSVGPNGGLASYRPGEQVTRSMTAEALACWQFLGLAREHPACDEAGDFLLGDLPGTSTCNFYYWYYGTLSMYQLQGPHWQRWNDSIRIALLNRQVKEGPQAGSWDTDDLWGGYGGRVFTTSLATMTLEVYYRFLPLYIGAATGRNSLR